MAKHFKKKESRRGFVVGAACLTALAAAAVALPAGAKGLASGLVAQAQAVAASLEEALSAAASRDFAAMAAAAEEASCGAAGLRETLAGPVWDLAEMAPVVGGDVSAARSLVDALSLALDEGLVPLARTFSGLDLGGLLVAGEAGQVRVGLPVLREACEAIASAAPPLDSAFSRLMGVGELKVGPLAQAVADLQGRLAPYASLVGPLGDLARVLPDVLGASGERLYVVMAQNNVEVRSIGGFAGQCARVEVHDGAVSVGGVSSIYDFIGTEARYCVPLSGEELELFGDTVGYMAGNTGSIPDFPRVCQIWRSLWRSYQGESPDGFIAVDPIFLQGLMGLVPPAQLPDGTVVDGTNTVRTLLHDTYWRYMDDPAAMDLFFSVAAGAALGSIVSGLPATSPAQLLDAVTRGVEDGNLLLWLADPAEQAALSPLGASGEVSRDPARPVLGVYLNNETWSKIEWWLDVDYEQGDPEPLPDGGLSYPCRLTLSNCATREEIDLCNTYMLGGNSLKLGPDDIYERVFLIAPAGGSVRAVSTSGAGELWEASYEGLQVLWGGVHNQMDAPWSVELEVVVSPQASAPLSAHITPTVGKYR